MAITRYRRLRDMDPFTRFFDFPADVFSDRLTDWPRLFGGDRVLDLPMAWHPSTDVYEEGDKVYVKMDLPGLTRDEIDVSFDGHILSVTGQRKTESEKDDGCYWSRERYAGEFHRYVHIPVEVGSRDLKAKYEDGVLLVTLEKAEKAKKTKIAIESGKK